MFLQKMIGEILFISESATYNKNKKETFTSSGQTDNYITSQGYNVITSNIFFD